VAVKTGILNVIEFVTSVLIDFSVSCLDPAILIHSFFNYDSFLINNFKSPSDVAKINFNFIHILVNTLRDTLQTLENGVPIQ